MTTTTEEKNEGAEKPAAAPEKPKLTVRSAASIALVVVGGVAAVGLLAAGGWIAAAAVPVAAGTGLYARHRMKNPKRTTTKGKLTWPLTGSQSHRALLPRGLAGKSSAGRKGGKTGSPGKLMPGGRVKGGRVGSLLPKTTRSRARDSAGGALRKHQGGRAVASRTRNTPVLSAGKPKGTKRPSTPSKTPARPSKASRLASGQSKARPSGSRSSTRRGGRSVLPKISGPRSSTSKPKNRPTRGTSSGPRRGGLGRVRSPFTSHRGSSGRTGGTGTPNRRPRMRSGLFTGWRKGSASPKRSSRLTSGTPGRSPGRTMRQRLNPFRRYSPSGKHSTARNPWKRTRPKMKTGNPQRMKSRDRIPRRTPSRPKPYRRTRARVLWRMALGLPIRNRKGKLRRPTPAMRRRSRRTLRLRALARLWALRKLPVRLGRWHWDRIFSKVPGPINPEWLKPTAEPDPPKPPNPTPPSGPGLATVIPINRKETLNIMSDGPHGVIAEAFNQLAQFEPQTAGEWERFLASQQELFVGMGQAYQTLADRARSGHAFNAQTAEALQDLAAAVGSLGEMAEQSHQAFGYNQ